MTGRRGVVVAVLVAAGLWGPPARGDEAPRNVLALETSWRDEAGARVGLGAWKGRWHVLSLIYTSCAGSCPLTTKKLKHLEAALEKAGRPLELVVVSLDPAHDTPEALKAYRARYQLENAARWHLLVGDDAQVRTLAMLLNFKFSVNPTSGVILHDNTVFLIAPDGSVRTSMSSLDQPLEEFVAAVPKQLGKR